jgi:hypothetical protein
MWRNMDAGDAYGMPEVLALAGECRAVAERDVFQRSPLKHQDCPIVGRKAGAEVSRIVIEAPSILALIMGGYAIGYWHGWTERSRK